MPTPHRRRTAGAVLLVCLACLTPVSPVLADNTADEADLAFALGNQAYAAREYDEALRSYFLSYRLVPNRNVLFNIARCYEALDRFDEAYRYYADLSRQQLAAEDAREVSRSLQRIRPRVALVQVETEPSGAEVYVDRKELGSRGRSPLTLALTPGKHSIFVEKDGHHPAQSEVAVSRGREVKEVLALKLVTGKVAVSGTPAGAWIRESADGPIIGNVPGEVALTPGRKILLVGAEGHGTSQVVVQVKPEETARAEIALGPAPGPTGKLVVTSNRDGALVMVDGLEAGFTPAVLTLTEGPHKIVVSHPELTPFETKVKIEADEEQRVMADLRYSPPPVKAASKSLASVDEAPASITVITREEIDAFGWQTLSEALASVRGIYVTDDRDYHYLGIRGFSPPGDLNTRVLILWDGHALNDVWAGQGFAERGLNVDLEEVARIEVVRGPGSALYGTGAFFAVINLVPRDSLGTRRNVEVTGGVGALGSGRGHATASWHPSDDVTFIASGAAYQARGADFTDLGSVGLVQGQDGERAYGASARARLGGVTLFAQVNNRHKDIPTAPFGTLVGVTGTRTTDAHGFAEARYDHTAESGNSLSARAYYDGTRYRGYWPSPGESDEVLTFKDAGSADWVGGEARYRLRVFGENHLTVGAEAQHQLRVAQEMFSSDSGAPVEAYRRTLLSAYLLDEWKLHPRVFLSLGLRVDKYLDLEVAPITPRLALIVRPYERGVTKLVAGSAFRAPNIYELYYHDLLISQRPAQSLDPETITTFELEHAHDLTRELRVTVSGYHNRISNLVVLDTEDLPTPECAGGTEQCFIYRNAPDLLRAFGAEAGLRWQPGRHAMVDVSYSFVNLVGASSQLQSGTPAHLASGKLMVPVLQPHVRLALQGTYQSARFSERVPEGGGEALLVNVGVSGETEHLRYFAGVQNLLDVRYAIPVGDEFAQPLVPQYGRTFAIQLTGSY